MAEAKTGYASLSVEDHIRTKDMWAGTIERIATNMMIFRRGGPRVLIAQHDSVLLSPALFKCVDEPIVNAIDQAQRSSATTEIRITFDEATGRITVANNGDGIPIEKRTATRDMYVPQFVFGVVFTGSNMETDETSTLGGTNGIGVKITNIHSTEFRVRTYDQARDKSFEQTWTNGMRECSPPSIRNGIPEGVSGTEVSFQLDYAHFKTEPREFEPVVFTRAIWAAFYASYLLPHVSFYWNDKRLAYTREQYASVIFAALTRAKTDPATVKNNITIDQTEDMIMIASPDVKRYAMSVINGIMVPTGNHVDFVFNKIQSATKANIQSSLGARDLPSIPGIRTISTRLAIIILWRATGVHWSGQSKNCAQFRTCDLISPSDSFIEALSKILADFVISRIDSLTGPRNGQNSGKTRIAIDKYTPANFAGTKKSAQCRLFLAEGDSAKSQVAKGLSRTFGFDYYGILSLRGVIPNVRKQAMQQVDSSTGEVKHKRSQKLIDNKFMTTLVQVLGIDFSKKYTSAQERQTLRYGGIIGCVDQDLDGVGNIFSLLLNLFHVFWPALIDAGFVQRLATPIIRAFPKTSKSKVHVLEFYSDEEYRKWVAETPNAESAFEISYYKGLGKHSPLEMQHIMSSIKTQIITYQNDPRALEMFEIYLGRLPELRKIQLARAPPRADPDLDRELLRSRRIPASYHLMRETHTYQLDNLHRKLNDVIGGMNQVLCKIVDGCFKIYARSANEKRKVVDLAGTISTMENYHHGETSLQDAILRRGFIAPGGNQLPFLLPGGNFGTRGKGGQDASAARYMTAQFNVRVNSVLYQAEDYSLLDFHIDEGKRGEPTFFVPIIPTAITEQIDVPAHGWNIRIWAREVMDVIANVRMLINTNGVASPLPMRPCCYPRVPIEPLPSTPPWNAECERVICNCTGADNASRYLWHGYIIERAFGKHPETWSIGTYTWISDDTILITELPLCVWTEPYMQNITKIADREGSMIKKFQYAPDDVKVNIRITFNLMSESFSALGITTREGDSPACLNDPLIVALYLRDHMSDNLNFMMPDESVHTFDTYQDIVAYWFPIRREYYARRVARQSELISVWILYYENIVRYIHMKREETIKSIAQTTVEEAEKILTEAHFNPLDTAALESPEIRFEVHVRERIINSSNASFAYILNLRERDVTLDGCKKFETELAKERAKLAELTAFAAIDMPSAPFIGAKIWLSELDTLVARINEGRATEWQFKDYGRFIYT